MSTALVSDATVAPEAPAPAPEATPFNSSTALVSDTTVAEAPTPPTEVVTAPPRRPWWVVILLLAGVGYLLTRRKEKR